MVLDIRQQGPQPERKTKAPQAVSATPAKAQDNLENLLGQALGGVSLAEQARAVEQLRQIVPSAEGLEILWNIIETENDPRRLVAAQVLGYHRSWRSSRSKLKRLLDRLRQERDPGVVTMLVWCLRQRDEIQEFLQHNHVRAAREAAVGLPLNSSTLPGLLQVLSLGGDAEIERILLRKLRHIHSSQVGELVDHLLGQEGKIAAERLFELFACLPQVPLFNVLLESRNLPAWDPHQGFDPSTTSAKGRQFAAIARRVLRQSPDIEILRYILGRSSEDESFARRHAAFLREVLHRVDGGLGSDLVKHLERLTSGASEEKVVRLAQLLVQFSSQLEGPAGSQALALLEEWKGRSASLKLKIYHLQQGLS